MSVTTCVVNRGRVVRRANLFAPKWREVEAVEGVKVFRNSATIYDEYAVSRCSEPSHCEQEYLCGSLSAARRRAAVLTAQDKWLATRSERAAEKAAKDSAKAAKVAEKAAAKAASPAKVKASRDDALDLFTVEIAAIKAENERLAAEVEALKAAKSPRKVKKAESTPF